MLLNFKVKKKAGPPKNHEMSLLFRRSSKISTRPVLRLPYFVFQKIMLKFAEFLHCIARRCLENMNEKRGHRSVPAGNMAEKRWIQRRAPCRTARGRASHLEVCIRRGRIREAAACCAPFFFFSRFSLCFSLRSSFLGKFP